MRCGSANTSSKLCERKVTKHKMTRDTSCESMMRNKGKYQKGVKNLFKDNNFRDWFDKGMKQNRTDSDHKKQETETKQHTKRLMSETETATQNGI